MSNGEALAQARHRAGLSVAQVSEQTRIRPLIIRSIEAADYSLCRGDYYAREDIRSIAEVVGADPGPLIEMYERVRRAPGTVPPPGPDEPPGPPRPAWHCRPAFMLAFGVVAIALTISSVGYRFMQEPGPGPRATAVAADKHTSLLHIAVGYPGHPDAAPAPGPAPGPAPARHPDPEQTLRRAHSMAPVSAVAFGPEGRGHGDDPRGAWLAIDGHRRTAWHTGRYTTARPGTLRPGTGLLLDMGHPVQITAIRVTLGAAAGASFQIRIGDQPKLADLRAGASSAGPGGIVRMTMARPATGRYVLVWFTRLPPGPGETYQADVHGIGVKARS
jgi:hypothetical protein